MNTIEVCQHVLTNGLSLIKPLEGGGYEIKGWDESHTRKETDEDVTIRSPKKSKGWMFLDAYTASAIVNIHKALTRPDLKVKFENMEILKAQGIAFKFCK